MSKVSKRLGVCSLAFVLGIVLFGLTGAFTARPVAADTPPNPPGRFVGKVLIDGTVPAVGTTVEARVGPNSCGTTSTYSSGGQQWYKIDVPALLPGGTQPCANDGDTVTFFVGGRQADQTGVWHNYQLNILDLTVTTPVITASPTAATPAGSPSPGASPTAPATPRPPAAGSGLGSDSGTAATWLFVAFGVAAFAFGIGGAAVARRSR
jgi:hypothetical protein